MKKQTYGHEKIQTKKFKPNTDKFKSESQYCASIFLLEILSKPFFYRKIVDRPEKATTRKVYNSFWDTLIVELNEIGPPKHSSQEWRKILAAHKNTGKLNQSTAEVAGHSSSQKGNCIS